MGGRNKKIRKDRVKDRRPPNAKSSSKRDMGSTTKITIGTTVAIILIFFSYAYNRYKIQEAASKVDNTLSGLLREESSVKVTPGTKVAVGLGSCLDIIVQSNQVVFDKPPDIPEHFYSIASKEEFLKVFSYFYRHGAAAERFISNSTFFGELVHLAEKASSARYHIGGNAPVMAKRFVKEGVQQVLLGAQMSKSLQTQFSKEVQISGPVVQEDDVHLLLEYPAGQRWGKLIPVRANRFIVHNDHQNPDLSSLELFEHQLEGFNPNLLVIGGLQMMDNFPMPENKRRNRLQKVQDLMKKVPSQVHIHFEMASFSDEMLLRELVESVIPYADSLGMNEQELPNLYQMMKYGNISLISEPRPRIAVVLDQMRDIFHFLQETAEMNGRRKLTRLHVHTLAFQAFFIDKHSSWKNTKAAAAKSSLVANRHTCGSDVIDISKAKLIMDDAFTTSLNNNNARRIAFDPNDPVSCWEEESIKVCIAPMLVCTDVVQTGGGGDNISSAGLVLQV